MNGNLMPEMNYCFIVNPAAGGGFAGRNWPALHERLLAAGIPHCYYLSEYRGHSGVLARTAREAGHRNFVVVGGAGMRFAPDAVAVDGLFEILQIKDRRITQVLGRLFYLYNGRINQH